MCKVKGTIRVVGPSHSLNAFFTLSQRVRAPD